MFLTLSVFLQDLGIVGSSIVQVKLNFGHLKKLKNIELPEITLQNWETTGLAKVYLTWKDSTLREVILQGLEAMSFLD